MGNCIKILFTLVALNLWACNQEPTDLPRIQDHLTLEENLLVGTWVYTDVVVDDQFKPFASPVMEFNGNRGGVGGNRADLFRRKINYSADGTYQLQWVERGDYDLGTEGDPNWQPNFGSWTIRNDSLIHNQGQFYETKYRFNVSEIVFTRTSDRYMSEPDHNDGWSAGDTVIFIENFERVLD